MTFPTLREEQKLWRKRLRFVAGIDEVGVGPLAGNITAAAVMLLTKETRNSKQQIRNTFKQVRDSKKLSSKKRELFYDIIVTNPAIIYSISSVSAKVIDRIGIRRATELAMFRCIERLAPAPDFIIFDGNRVVPRNLKPKTYTLIIKADEKVLSCALASIIAKVRRDRAMIRFHRKYPEYGFAMHKGYGTKAHMEAIRIHGVSPLHRRSFAPVASRGGRS